tara:strand:+ start:82 stop:384 length:303 start_codon:yes stop_codon:yes gene_type:complete
MELLNFLEECEKPAPTLCFDLMELIGTHVETIRNIKHHKDEFKKVLREFTNTSCLECGVEPFMNIDEDLYKILISEEYKRVMYGDTGDGSVYDKFFYIPL